SEPYEPEVSRVGPSSPRAPSGPTLNPKFAAIQVQIDESVEVMRDNIQKVNERGAALDSLEEKAEALVVSSQGFKRGAADVRKRMWWKDMKMRLIIGLGVSILLVVIIVPIVKTFK
ncbi:hypothetical protein M422DRAFT_161696, partial [Sphaerobolus stellatus SS14]